MGAARGWGEAVRPRRVSVPDCGRSAPALGRRAI